LRGRTTNKHGDDLEVVNHRRKAINLQQMLRSGGTSVLDLFTITISTHIHTYTGRPIQVTTSGTSITSAKVEVEVMRPGWFVCLCAGLLQK